MFYAAGLLRGGREDTLAELSFRRWQEMLDVQLGGVFLCAQQFGRDMKNAGNGHILIMSSVHAINSPEIRLSYGSSKSALSGLNQAISKELAPEVKSFLIVAGPVESPAVRRIWGQEAERYGYTFEQYRDLRVRSVPLKRLASYDDVSNLAIFLASGAGDYLTGTELRLTAGVPEFPPDFPYKDFLAPPDDGP